MQFGFRRPLFTVNIRCLHARATHYSLQEGIRSVSSFATALQELKNNSGKLPTIGTKKAERKRAYDYASAEAIFARHVLRTILRECSYLPDSFAADYIRNHAFSRFRTNEYKAWRNRNQFESQDKSRRKEARSVISTLQRANDGERRCMLKVLHTAYGRIGKRRHELIRPIVYVEGQDEILSEGSKAVGDASGAARPKEKAAAKTKLAPTTPLDLTPQLRALLTSQIQAKPPCLARTTLRSVEPSISTLNSWLQPMPQNRIRNARKKHYAMLLDRVQAPLPAEEWERLRDLATGRLPAVGLVERRKLARSSSCKSNAVGREHWNSLLGMGVYRRKHCSVMHRLSMREAETLRDGCRGCTRKSSVSVLSWIGIAQQASGKSHGDPRRLFFLSRQRLSRFLTLLHQIYLQLKPQADSRRDIGFQNQ